MANNLSNTNPGNNSVLKNTNVGTQITPSQIKYKRGLLDILDIHACAGSEVGTIGRGSRSKDGVPYAPSLMSMPSSTTVDSIGESSQRKEDSKSPYTLNENCKQYIRLNENQSSKNLGGISHFSTCSHKTSDDEDKKKLSCISKRCATNKSDCISDILPEQSDESLLNCSYSLKNLDDSRTIKKHSLDHFSIDGLSIMSANSKSINEVHRSINDISNKDLISDFNSSEESFEVTHTKNRRHRNKRNRDSFNGDISSHTILFEGSLMPTLSNEHTMQVKSKENVIDQCNNEGLKVNDQSCLVKKSILHLFDCNKYPLTDSEGNILKTANDQNLVIFKNGKPFYDCFDRLIFDENGRSSENPEFQPYGVIFKSKKKVAEIQVYDFRGYPLLDHDGTCLVNADGWPLVVLDEYGGLLHDINGHPIFDKSGIPLTKKNGCWLTPKGTPFRVFNFLQYPLTDKYGIPLYSNNGIELLKCDRYGRPVFCSNGESVHDMNGHVCNDPRFDPSVLPSHDDGKVTALIENRPVQIYNQLGFPLTEPDGTILKDSNGNYLLPIENASLNSSLINGKYIELKYQISSDLQYDLHGNKMAIKGNEHYHYQPLKDKRGGPVYDIVGRRILLDHEISHPEHCWEPSMSKRRSSQRNMTLAKIYSSTNINNASEISDVCSHLVFETQTDIFGRPLFTTDGTPLFDKFGRPIYDLYLRPLYDSLGRPIATADAKLLSDGSDEGPGVILGFDLEDISRSPEVSHEIRDTNGGPLFDKLGNFMYSKRGKPLTDAFGRPLYDEHGIPLCDEYGLPASVLIKQRKERIMSVEDRFQKLKVTSNQNVLANGSQDENEDAVLYNARVRITTFINGEKLLELLEIAPFERE